MTTTTLPTLIFLLAGVAIGAVVGSLWGLSQHRHIYNWLAADFISRMQRAMRSCGHKQEEIDMIVERMGMRIMPPSTPCPPPQRHKEKNI